VLPEGLPDNTACIGDRFQIGTALFEVTQPRVTCFRVVCCSRPTGDVVVDL
jgi:MOSC domain-containing protein YiiM